MTQRGFDRRAILAGLAASGVASAFAASDPITGAISRAARGTAPLRILAPKGCEANIAPVAAAFQAASGLDVEINTVSLQEINTTILLTALAEDARYDVVVARTYGIPDLVDAGALLALDDFAAEFEAGSLEPTLLHRTGDVFDHRLYGYQTDGNAYMMWYHADMLADPALQAAYADRHGTALAVPQTWAELDRQLAFLHRPEKGRFGGVMYRDLAHVVLEWWSRFLAKGSWPFSPTLDPQIAGEAGVTVLEDMVAATRYLAPTQTGNFENWERYAQGDAYCAVGFGGMQKYLNKPDGPMRGRLRHASTPGGIIGGQHVEMPMSVWSWSYAVSPLSRRPDLAYLFTCLAVAPDISTRAVRESEGFFDPFRHEHYRDAEIVATYSQPFLDVHERILRNSIPDLFLARQSSYTEALRASIFDALEGRSTPAEAMARASDAWELANLKVDRTAQMRRWSDLRAIYPAPVRAALRDVS